MTELMESRLRLMLKAERETLLKELSALITTRRPNDDRKLTAKEAAAFLGISLSSLYKNIKFLPHRKFGKKLVFVLKELHEFNFASLPENKQKLNEGGNYAIPETPNLINDSRVSPRKLQMDG